MHRPEAVTGRTETSQYPQEKKETSTSLVAASERESAQTGLMEASMRFELGVMGGTRPWCCAAGELQKSFLVESNWKVGPKKVKVL